MRLVSRPEVYVQRIKVVAEPDLVRRSARVRVLALLSGAGAVVNACVFREGQAQAVGCVSKKGAVAGANGFDFTVAAKDCRFWDQDHPNMYRVVVQLGADTLSAAFGIRQMRVQGTKLLLNGEAVRFGGANRPIDYPGFGSMDPPEVIEKDLGLMKSGGMELSRIIHYPVSDEFLDWADRHGLMIIEEAGNWQMTPKQLSDPVMRKKFESQMREMVERDWNHPCVVAWSVGNEFQSQTEEGKKLGGGYEPVCKDYGYDEADHVCEHDGGEGYYKEAGGRGFAVCGFYQFEYVWGLSEAAAAYSFGVSGQACICERVWHPDGWGEG
ncbi:glycoside hydrolase family 2 TIM barrel-domain containing protein [Puia sp. P3]|uniref:glycoside hydrolase family 2 TIM barrel-domain containing protein n=1 Tax=Puia sp. P3 TaxID=3423952 RepID=UPI003D66B7B8